MRPSLVMLDTVKSGGAFIADVTGRMTGWRRSIRATGGFWSGRADYLGTREDLLDMYLNGIGRQIKEQASGMITWEGFVAEMTLTMDGQTYSRSLLETSNAVRVIYQKIGSNLFTDGSAESTLWAAVGTPSTRELSTAWASEGIKSCHLVTDAAGEGGQVQTGITLASGYQYLLRMTLNVVAGDWTVGVYKVSDNTLLAAMTSLGTGLQTLDFAFDNTYAGTVYVNVTAAATGAEVYCDSAVLQVGPYQAQTKWYEDADSQADYGRIEEIVLTGGMTDATATALGQKTLYEKAWPRSRPPERITVGQRREDKLSLTVLGHVFTLAWRYVRNGGTDGAGTHIGTLVGESEFITAGIVDSNTLSVQIPDRDPVRLWDGIAQVIAAGDSSGNRWKGGVYAGKTFHYEQASTTAEYIFSGGRLLYPSGVEVAPWFALPGLVKMSDAPMGPGQITGRAEDDPRYVYMTEVEYVAPDGLVLRGSP
jgi:hypothetical protein